ncbi:MAG: hypothetical protein ACPGOV_12000 [Magnetovibrionaceae bacterium]
MADSPKKPVFGREPEPEPVPPAPQIDPQLLGQLIGTANTHAAHLLAVLGLLGALCEKSDIKPDRVQQFIKAFASAGKSPFEDQAKEIAQVVLRAARKAPPIKKNPNAPAAEGDPAFRQAKPVVQQPGEAGNLPRTGQAAPPPPPKTLKQAAERQGRAAQPQKPASQPAPPAAPQAVKKPVARKATIRPKPKPTA